MFGKLVEHSTQRDVRYVPSSFNKDSYYIDSPHTDRRGDTYYERIEKDEQRRKANAIKDLEKLIVLEAAVKAAEEAEKLKEAKKKSKKAKAKEAKAAKVAKKAVQGESFFKSGFPTYSY